MFQQSNRIVGGARPLGQDLFVGGGLLLAPEAEHSLEGGHGRASVVEAEGERRGRPAGTPR
jgi:hypothetical protein